MAPFVRHRNCEESSKNPAPTTTKEVTKSYIANSNVQESFSGNRYYVSDITSASFTNVSKQLSVRDNDILEAPRKHPPVRNINVREPTLTRLKDLNKFEAFVG